MPPIRTKAFNVPIDVTTVQYNSYYSFDAYPNDELLCPLVPSHSTPIAPLPMLSFGHFMTYPYEPMYSMQRFPTPAESYTTGTHQPNVVQGHWLSQPPMYDTTLSSQAEYRQTERPPGPPPPSSRPIPALNATHRLPPPRPRRPAPASGAHSSSKRKPNIKKPSNAFILFRSDLLTRLPNEKTKGRNASVVAGEHWRLLSPAEQQPWYDLAYRERLRYEEQKAVARDSE